MTRQIVFHPLRDLRILIWVAALATQLTAQMTKGLTAEQVVALERVTQVALSPAGDKIAYTLSVPRYLDEPPGRSYS